MNATENNSRQASCAKRIWRLRLFSFLLSGTLLSAVLCFFFPVTIEAQTTAFTYQGRLTDNGNQANGTYEMQFRLFDTQAAGTGTQLGSTITNASVPATNGIFAVNLDFGAAVFSGATLYLEVSLRPAGSNGGYTSLAPRQRLTSAPYAVKALNATNATNAATSTNFSGSLAGEVSGTQNATVINSVGGQTAASIASGTQLANSATNLNTPSALVRRDAATGGFSAAVATIDNFRLTLSRPPGSSEILRIDAPSDNLTTPNGPILRLRSDPLGATTNGLLTTRFAFDRSGSFVAHSKTGWGIIPTTGEGERLMWHGFKTAFRAGSASIAGEFDEANIGFYSWAGGDRTIARGEASFSFGSLANAEGKYAVAMGFTTRAIGEGSIALGYKTSAVGTSTVALGGNARTGCQTGDESCATAFARNGSFVFGDNSTTNYFDSTVNNEFAVRATGGFRFRTSADLLNGCNLAPGGGSFSCTSSRARKENFETLDGADVLRRLRKIPVMRWSYIEEEKGIRHIGAFAEDFYSEFKLGTDDKSIGVLDVAGVNMAAVKALDERTESLQKENTELRRQIEEQKTQIQEQLRRDKEQQQQIDALIKLVCSQNTKADVCKQEK